MSELLALLAQYRGWMRRYDDRGMTAAIHGRPLPGSILERVKSMQAKGGTQ